MSMFNKIKAGLLMFIGPVLGVMAGSLIADGFTILSIILLVFGMIIAGIGALNWHDTK